MKIIDRLGKRYDRLLVVSRAPNKSSKDTNARWNCRCDCGNTVVAYGQDLKRGKVKSCGCWNDERIAAIGHGNKTHGMTGQRVHRIWMLMISRCGNSKGHNWRYYGGRGIKVCARWRTFENFVSDMGVPSAELSLDRIDNNGNYEKNNCRWSTAKEQASNRRNSRKLTHNGMTLTVAEWARVLGISAASMHGRIAVGMPKEKLFSPKMK